MKQNNNKQNNKSQIRDQMSTPQKVTISLPHRTTRSTARVQKGTDTTNKNNDVENEHLNHNIGSDQSDAATSNDKKLVSHKMVDDSNIWFEICSATMFQNFQRTVYPIIQEFVTNIDNEHHNFVIKWNAMQMIYTISEKTTFISIKRHHKFTDVKSYVAFLQQCPAINHHIIIRPTSTNSQGFEYGIISAATELQQEYLTQTLSDLHECTIIATISADTPTTSDVIKLIHIITLILQEYILLYPDDDLSNTYRTWLEEGLSQLETLEELTDLMECSDLYELYYILGNTKALQESTRFEWKDKTLSVYLHNDYDTNKPILQPTGEYNYIQHDQHLQIFHSKIFKSIFSWSTDPNNYQNPTCNKWNNAIQEGMKEQTSWEEIKVLLGISSYKEYYNMIAHCNTIRQQYYMFLVDNTYISYCTYQPTIDVPKPIPVTPVKNNLSTSNSWPVRAFYL